MSKGNLWATQQSVAWSGEWMLSSSSLRRVQSLVVFGGFDADAEELLWGGTMRQRFAPDWLRVSRSGEFFHALENGRYGDYGLVGSAVAHSLSSRLSGGEDGDLRLLWDGERHVVRRVTFGGDDADGFL